MNKLNYIKDIRDLSMLLAWRKPPYRSNITINILTLYKKATKISWKDLKEDFEFCRRLFEKKNSNEYIHWLLELIIDETSEEDLMKILIDIFTIETIQELCEFFYIDKLPLLKNKWDILKDFSDEVWKKIKDCWIDFWQLSKMFVDIWYSRTTVEKITQSINDKQDVSILLFELLKEYRHLWEKLHKYLYLLANKFDNYNYGLSWLVRWLISSKLENDEVQQFKNIVQNKLRLDFNILKEIILSTEDYKYYKSNLDKMNDLYDLFSSDLIVSSDSKTQLIRKVMPLLEKELNKKSDIDNLKKELVENWITSWKLWSFLKTFWYYYWNIKDVTELPKKVLSKPISEYIDDISFHLDIDDNFLNKISSSLFNTKKLITKDNQEVDAFINSLEKEWVSVKILSYSLRDLGYIELDQAVTCRDNNVRNFMIDALDGISEDVNINDMIKRLYKKISFSYPNLITDGSVVNTDIKIDIYKISLYLAWKLPPHYLKPNLLRFIRLVNELFPEYYKQKDLEIYHKQSDVLDKFFFMILDDIYSEIWLNDKFKKLLKWLNITDELYISSLDTYNNEVVNIIKELQLKWVKSNSDIWISIIAKTIHKYKIFSEDTINIQSELWNYFCNECEKKDFEKFFKKLFDKLEKIDYNISDFISILKKEIKSPTINTLIFNNNIMSSNLQNVSGEVISQRLQEKWGSVTLLKKDTKQIKSFLTKVEERFWVTDLKWIKFVSYSIPEDEGNLWLTVVLNVETLTKSFIANGLSLEDVLNAKNYIKDRLSTVFDNYAYTDLIEWKDEEAVLYKIASEIEWLILESDISSKFNEDDKVTYETNTKKYYGKITARIFNKTIKSFEYSTTFSPALWDYAIGEDLLKIS